MTLDQKDKFWVEEWLEMGTLKDKFPRRFQLLLQQQNNIQVCESGLMAIGCGNQWTSFEKEFVWERIKSSYRFKTTYWYFLSNWRATRPLGLDKGKVWRVFGMVCTHASLHGDLKGKLHQTFLHYYGSIDQMSPNKIQSRLQECNPTNSEPPMHIMWLKWRNHSTS